jgi:hypothetical protein
MNGLQKLKKIIGVDFMIIKIRKKIYDSNKESIGMYLNNDELAKLTHHYLYTNPKECVLIFNGTRREDRIEDYEKTRCEGVIFAKEVNKYVMKKNPKLKPLSSVEVA